MKFYEVGGAVRDELMGVSSKDVDFAVEAQSFEHMEAELKTRGFTIFLSTPEYFTIRARVPKDSPLHKRTEVADFVLCRKDGIYKDGRRPESVEAGTILDDLARRDFTVNAIAKDEDGNLIDPYNGADDIKKQWLRFVGNPMERIQEDGLRVLRFYRFLLIKNLYSDEVTWRAVRSNISAEMVRKVSIERIKDELEKMFVFDTQRTLGIMSGMTAELNEAIFRNGLWLMPTLKKVGVR
jgi:tRNA nucleotidyltransferase (CCA-adding enzyme)